ncbi:hypothetical protein [Nocardia camponoti]|uniref:Uncharacterized protein n=1 Tax=Nocardia camponoti TaxID=1616106 RepID=A0A917QSK0_9NOCA|nr:hypothetical protein [Nocardia camponoti]GGK66478.1 hypothetical protein GCM10011591_43280 [Nocardia camponoti]
MSSDHRSDQNRGHHDGFAEFTDELKLLAEVLLARVEPVLRRTAADGDAELGGCAWCPVCAAAALVRGEHHDVVAALADHGTAVVTILREALAGVPVEPLLPPEWDGPQQDSEFGPMPDAASAANPNRPTFRDSVHAGATRAARARDAQPSAANGSARTHDPQPYAANSSARTHDPQPPNPNGAAANTSSARENSRGQRATDSSRKSSGRTARGTERAGRPPADQPRSREADQRSPRDAQPTGPAASAPSSDHRPSADQREPNGPIRATPIRPPNVAYDKHSADANGQHPHPPRVHPEDPATFTPSRGRYVDIPVTIRG